MQTDLSTRHWLGMAAVCAITMAAGIPRTRLAQDSIEPDVPRAIHENRRDAHDHVPAPAADHLGGGVPR